MIQKLKSLKLIAASGLTMTVLWLPASVAAATDPCNQTNPTSTSLNACVKSNPIVKDLNSIVNVLSGLVGVVVVGVIILGGIQYSMAGDKAEAVSAAKKRITNGLIALLAFMFIFAFLQWLIPGGVFK
jgi:hypothetical protein